MIVVSASDEAFVPHFATMLHSAWFHNPNAEFFLLDCGIELKTREVLESFADELSISLTIIPIDLAGIVDLPKTDHWSAAAYARLLSPSYLPADAEKALYIDADCVIVSDLSELWAIELGSCLVAGVRDVAGRKAEIRKGNSDLPDYINTGVMLLSLTGWRDENLSTKALNYARENALLHVEQSALNTVASDRIQLISEEWNFSLSQEFPRTSQRVAPCIVHFTGPRKPWLYKDVAFSSIYNCHRNATPYKTACPTRRYRSRPRIAMNLIALRPKYWRLLRLSRYYNRTFTKRYLNTYKSQIDGNNSKFP